MVAVGLAWAGQAITTRDLPHGLGALDFLDGLFTAYRNAPQISAALVLLGTASVILAFVSLRRGDEPDDGLMLATTRPISRGSALDAIMGLGVAAGLGLWALFLWVLHDHKYHHPVNLALLIAVVLIALPLIKRDFFDRPVHWSINRALLWHLAFVLTVAGLFIYLNARDLGSWKYSAVGDEYSTFSYGLGIAKGAFFNPWSHRGAGETLAILTSAGEGLFMRLGNEDNFAWRFHNVVIAAASFLPFYFLVCELFRARVAILALGFFAASHYLFGYAHHVGYLDALLPTNLGLWLLVVGLKRDSSVALFASGLSLALGFYGFETGRAAVVVVSFFMLTFGIRSFRPAVFVPLALGFVLLALPLFATDGPSRVFHQMFDQSAVNYSSTVTGDRWHRLAVNIQYSFVSFNFSNAGRHYVWGSLADPLTAMLFVMGLGVVAVRVRRPAHRLLLIWWLVEVAFGGFSNPYPMPPISRLQSAIPPVAVFAAIAADAIMRPFTDLSPMRRIASDRSWQFATSSLAIVVLLASVLSLNLYRFWYQMPRRLGTPTDETAVVRAYRLPACKGQNVVIIARDPLALLDRVFRSYNTEPMPTFLNYPEAIESLSDMETPDCLIVQRTGSPSDKPADLANVIAQRFPNFIETDITDPSKKRLANLFTPSPVAPP